MACPHVGDLRVYALAVGVVFGAGGCFTPASPQMGGGTTDGTDTTGEETAGVTEPSSTGAPTGGSQSEAGTTPATSTDPTSDASSESGSSSSDDTAGGPVCALINGEHSSFECSTYAQDCGPGQKCLPWAVDGGIFNATRCSEVADDPGGLGEPCTTPGGPVAGEDDCDVGLICMGASAGTGTCAQLCGCEDDAASCDSGTCVVANEGTLPVCFDSCDPLSPRPCGGDVGCYLYDTDFFCIHDDSGDGGYYLDPCRGVNDCDPGSMCIPSKYFPACGGFACCTPYCNADDPEAAMACPDFGVGQQCVGVFGPGEAPEGAEDVGVCATPP